MKPNGFAARIGTTRSAAPRPRPLRRASGYALKDLDLRVRPVVPPVSAPGELATQDLLDALEEGTVVAQVEHDDPP